MHAHQERGVFAGMGECVMADGKVVYLDLNGFSHREEQIRLTERTLFRGYSMMKPLTAVAFMTMIEEKLLRLDDPVARYIPQFGSLKVKSKSGGVEPLERPITLRHLLMHTAGFGYGPAASDMGCRIVARTESEKLYKDICLMQDSGQIASLEHLCDALSSKPLLFQPGSNYEYSFSFDVLGRVMEIAAGMPVNDVIKERVLLPVGMKDAAWDIPPARASQLSGYYRIMRSPGSSTRWLQKMDGARPEQSVYVRKVGSKCLPAGGGFWGTYRTGMLFSMRDILVFCQMLLNEGVSVSGRRVLKASTMRSLRTNWLEKKAVVDKWMPANWNSENVGWNPLGHIQLSGPHTGAMYMGGMSYFWIEPRRKIVAVIMTETYWQVQPLGWKAQLDNLEEVVQRSVAAANIRKRKKTEDADARQPSKVRRA